MQVDHRAGRAAPSRPASNVYLMSWVAVAAFGLGYIAVAATRPDLLGSLLPIADAQQEQVVTGREAADLADEITTLRKWVNDLQHELAATKSNMQEHAADNATIVQRLAAAEERLAAASREVRSESAAPAAPSAAPGRPPATAQRPPARGQASAVAETPQRTASAPSSEGAPATAVKVLNPSVTPIATGSVPERAAPAGTPSFGPAKVAIAPPTTPRAVEIASSESLDGLRAKWGELTGRNPETLGDLAPRYRLAADGRQAPFTLLAGPFGTPVEAARACNALRAKGVSCRVGAYAGNAF